ncbi:MAG: PLP-dependent transferase, partial [Hyphomicrobiales bacterium]|nr:PLP-dependent transferase [Hyphomicrobiales bacterium]
MTDQPGFSTLAVHAGAQPDPATGARATPIYQTTAFVFDNVDHAASLFGLQAFGNIYSRIGNPTCAVLEERVAALEGGTAALAVASGHAAEFVTFHTLMQPGDELIAATKL